MNNDRGSTQFALISLIIAVIAIFVGVSNPEIRQFFGLEKKPNSYVQNTPVVTPTSTEIKSEVGVEAQLQELAQLLKQGDFKTADEKTLKIMIDVANREKEGWVDSNSMAKFSCTDLRTIDQLWVNNSNGRFGFSVQKRILEENGKDWHKFANAVGWKSGELTFAKNAKKGHLPSVVWVAGELEYGGKHGKGGEGNASFFLRLDTCKMYSNRQDG